MNPLVQELLETLSVMQFTENAKEVQILRAKKSISFAWISVAIVTGSIPRRKKVKHVYLQHLFKLLKNLFLC